MLCSPVVLPIKGPRTGLPTPKHLSFCIGIWHWLIFLKINILVYFPSSSLSWTKNSLKQSLRTAFLVSSWVHNKTCQKGKACIQSNNNNTREVLLHAKSEQPKGNSQILAYSQGFFTSSQIIILAIGGSGVWACGICEPACLSQSFVVTPCREALASLKQTQQYPAWGFACWAGFTGAAPWGYSVMML